MKSLFLFLLIGASLNGYCQKKPLDHSVYDSWQSIGERIISNNGKLVAYTIVPQEGDATMVLQESNGKKLIQIDRGYNVKFSEDNMFLICKIKPTYKQTRDGKIKKKKADEMPKDSLAVINLSTFQTEKIARVRSYKMPEKKAGWLAYQMEKPISEVMQQKKELDSLSRIKSISKIIDSLTREADSLRNKLAQVQSMGIGVLKSPAISTNKTEENTDEGTALVLLDLNNRQQQTFQNVNDYLFNKYGNVIVIKTAKKANNVATILKHQLAANTTDTILRSFNDAKGLALDEKGEQLAFVAERDSSKKESQKFYKLYYSKGNDSASLLADRFTKGIPSKWTISEFGNISFSKSGQRLFFGTAPIIPLKDTSLPEFERVSVDIWNYKDEDLMTYQLHYNDTLLKRNYLARYDFNNKDVVQLANEKLQRVDRTEDGDGNTFYAASDYGKRVEKQWQGYTLEDWYSMDPVTGATQLITTNWKGRAFPSYSGSYLLLYNDIKKGYSIYNNSTRKLTPVATDIKTALYDEENDEPADPATYGIAKWMQDDKYVLINDRYDVWKVDPIGKERSVSITNGRKDMVSYRYESMDPEERTISPMQPLVFKTFDEKDKSNGITILNNIGGGKLFSYSEKAHIVSIAKSPETNELLLVKETYQRSPNVFTLGYNDINTASSSPIQLSDINPQQSIYLWGSAELFKWKAYTGKVTEGILYKPENFDPKKKYPMIVYFYDRNNTTLYNYQPPAPTPSRLNIPFFVSRGYVVFVPDIWYKKGHPGQSAYDYIVSGTRALVKLGFIDSTRLGIQGQSWGGYQAAYVITRTNLYKAAWAGAPVVNMFSAYGGIRWESGVTRQSQYELGQSRLGATLWDKPELYIENSPLFHLKQIKTPLVIMSNDADGAVPWYQGIEFFTAMRRLQKPVWLLSYNGEAHNLVERKNRKDIQMREQQYFDWLLKDATPPKWITEGVPATMKGRDLGLGLGTN